MVRFRQLKLLVYYLELPLQYLNPAQEAWNQINLFLFCCILNKGDAQ